MGNRKLMKLDIPSLLLPADIDEILDNYGHLLQTYSNLREKHSIFSQYKRTHKRLEVLFPLKEHPIHGITGLHVIEVYDEAGYVERYHYHWKRIIPKKGIMYSHITSWGNDPHDDPETPEEYKVKTEPHHHHYDPKDRKKRRENYDVHTLEQAFDFIDAFLESGEEYTGELKQL
ncbi:hypothetical protein F9U64_19250 [Gracilibacillus oryzae]|uniref:Uncharacterized protein n=1 Tax=Gracilibacillus oryzae TaxID=1672701 RepID=A0A7C8KRR3_9BACI|nr:DUF6516 family protein [Gracilibacillus oryzae]KAB8126745.1 hypothetical protein F9U64_19250 [Gracilibacillus oryzae]